ncbi:MAG TPA: OmpH family outer membrane protein [Pirellulales bacterium]|nr:OmpH family outer membrane protein [Pirellulales bacterium]
MLKPYQLCALLALGAVAFLAGCDSERSEAQDAQAADVVDAGKTRIGVIDVEQVYQLMGLRHQRNARIMDLQKRQTELHADQKTAFEAKFAEFGGDAQKLTDEQKLELQKMEATSMESRRKSAAEAERILMELDQFLNNLYMQATRKPIRNVAEAEGLDVVLVKQRNMFAYIHPDVDITEKVIEQLDLPATLPPATPLPKDPATPVANPDASSAIKDQPAKTPDLDQTSPVLDEAGEEK